MKLLLLICAVCTVSTNAIAIEEPRTSDVLDLGAWVGTWMVALGAYSGRQERPWRRRGQGFLDDLPDVYIPNELTANEIERSFSLAGKKQAVIEANEMMQYAEFIGTRKQGPEEQQYLQLEDGHIKAHPEVLPELRNLLSQGIGLEQELVDTIVEVAGSLKIKSKFDDWDDMSGELDRVYQEIVGKALEKNYLKKTDEGHYTLTSTVTELVQKTVKDIFLTDERRWRLRDEIDYEAFKENEKYKENVSNMVNSAMAIVQLPGDMTWAGIKSAIQAMYKKAIPQVHLFQFLTKKLDYLTLDQSVGLSKLSPFVTQAFVDSLYWFFPTPLRQYN